MIETNEHPAASCMAFVRSMRKQWAELAGRSSDDFEAQLDRYRRPYREKGGRPIGATKEHVNSIFSLYWGNNLTQHQVSAATGIKRSLVSKILQRQHPLSKHRPLHPLEKQYLDNK